MRYLFLGILLGCGLLGVQAQQDFLVISYNVENLFDVEADSLGRDAEYTPEGARHWSYGKYQTKLRHLAQVIANIGEWNKPALVGLLEVENAHCLEDLTRYHLTNYHYRFLHQESPDVRGIDCALLYDERQFWLVDSAFLPVPIEGRATRDIVYAKGVIGRGVQDTLHVLLCHLPSQLGGAVATEERREAAVAVLQKQIDAILQVDAEANIVVMGDMNQEPKDNLRGVRNRMIGTELHQHGTHKYQGVWNFLDQFYTAGSLLDDAHVGVFAPEWLLEDDPTFGGKRPLRTFVGFRYQPNGYSDHLPIYLLLKR